MNPARFAVDVGVTLTGVVLLSEGGELTFGKVATTPAGPTEGVIAAFDRADTPLSSVAVLTHGTTLGLSALLIRTGARTAVMARQSFRDVCLLGRTARKTNYRKPPGLLERADQLGAHERVLHDGSVHISRRPCTNLRNRGWRNTIRWGSDDGHDGSRATGQPDPSGPVGHVIRSRGVLENRRRFRPGDD